MTRRQVRHRRSVAMGKARTFVTHASLVPAGRQPAERGGTDVACGGGSRTRV